MKSNLELSSKITRLQNPEALRYIPSTRLQKVSTKIELSQSRSFAPLHTRIHQTNTTTSKCAPPSSKPSPAHTPSQPPPTAKSVSPLHSSHGTGRNYQFIPVPLTKLSRLKRRAFVQNAGYRELWSGAGGGILGKRVFVGGDWRKRRWRRGRLGCE